MSRPIEFGFDSIMKILTSGKQLDLGDSLRAYVDEKLPVAVAKYMDNAIEAQVVFSRDGAMYNCHCSVHVGTGIDAQADAQDPEIYASFDQALDRLAKQLRRDKRKRRNHHTRVSSTGPAA
jgi:ribosomal subunit interface protein